MTPERYKEVGQLYRAALEIAADQRDAFLAQACGSDEALRQEIASLLDYREQDGGIIDQPVLKVAAQALAPSLVDDPMTNVIGQSFGHYRLLSLLGKGGMGEVYLGEDTQLSRKVAVKLLPAKFTADPTRVRRFAQEARAVSALNHPNIITIHEIGQASAQDGGAHYIVTEYVAGEPLRHRLASAPHGRIEPTEAIDIALQIAAALAAAHEAGITHRDIKPENVMVRRDGIVKVLDFGLAKLTEVAPPIVDLQASTLTRNSTEAGLVMGTPRYMSPEQARGEKVDTRTDIFSLGVMLYEMIVGHAPFTGATTSDVIAAILKDEVRPFTSYTPDTPPELERIVGKALCKSREERYQTANDLLADLKQLQRDLEFASEGKKRSGARGTELEHPPAVGKLISGIVHQARLVRQRLIWMASLSVLVIGGGVFLYLLRHNSQSTLPPIKVVPLTSLPGTKMTPAFSPDGNQIAIAWNRNDPPGVEIYKKLISQGEPQQLTHSGKLNFSPVWSPDGQRIAFVRCSENEAAIFMISAYGDGEHKLLSFKSRGFNQGERRISWSPDEKFLAFADSDENQPSRGNVIFLLSPDTGKKRALTSPSADQYDEGPAFSPDAHDVAFVRRSNSDSCAGFDLYVVPVSGGEPRRLTFGDDLFWTGPTWTEDGREIVFSSKRAGSSALWRIPVSGGIPQRLEVGSDDSINPSISRQGHRLAYMRIPEDYNIYRVVLPDAGNPGVSPATFLPSTRIDGRAQLSPDGKRVAFQSNRSGGTEEIWVCDTDGSNCAPVTSFGRMTERPRWAPDGKRIVCESSKDCKTNIYAIDLETRGVRDLVSNPSEESAPNWSRDGQWVYFGSKRSGSWQIWKVPAEGGAPVQVTKQGGFFPCESPDARFVYYEKGGDIAGVWRVPSDGGEEILILDQLKRGMSENWAVVDDGIYFIRFVVNTNEEGAILFSDFATGGVKEIVKLGRHHIIPGGLAVSSDRHSFFYTVWEHQAGADVMLVENFR